MARVWVHDRMVEERFAERVAAAKRAKRLPPMRWQVTWYDLDGTKCTELHRKESVAGDRRDELAEQLRAGTYLDPKAGRTKLAKVAEAWWTAKAPRWAPRTRRHYREILDGYVLPRWGSTAIGAVAYDDVATWLAGLHKQPGMSGSEKRKLGASRVQGIYQAMRGVMTWAVKGRKITENPIRGLDKDTLPAVPKAKHLYLDHHQISALVDAVGKLETAYGKPKPGREVYQVMVLTLAYCGLRIGEAAALRAGSVDLDAGELHVVEALGVDDDGQAAVGLPKGGKIRVVGIPAFLALELKVLKSGLSDEDLMFPSPKGEMLNLYNWRQRIFRPAVKAATLADGSKLSKETTPHTLRHSFASLSVAAGADVKTLQAAMGHASATMTLDVYSDLFPARVGEVALALSAAREVALAA